MRLTRLRIKNWRNFKDAEVHLESRAFFVGPNASGKSNLLDVLRFLNDLTVDGGGIQKATSNRGGVGEIRSFAARSKPIIMIEVELGNDEEPAAWIYSLEFNASKDSGRPIVVREIVRRHGVAKPVLERPDRDDNADAARLSETAIEQVSANKNFREIAAFFASIRYLHVIPQIIREPGRSSGHNDPFGGDLIERINATKPRQRDARLKRMEEALRIAVPQLRNLELEIDKKGIPHLRAQYVHWRPQGAWQRQDRFSDGTLRLLGLIWALQESGGPLLLEEPEMSLNAGVVERLAPMISRANLTLKAMCNSWPVTCAAISAF